MGGLEAEVAFQLSNQVEHRLHRGDVAPEVEDLGADV